MTTTPPPFDPWSLMRSMLQLAPTQLNQPILPLTYITNYNSSAPQTEARIVSQHSYGRQLGRLSDAVQALIDKQYPKGVPDGPDGPLARFASLREEIEELKADGVEDRLDRVSKDLQTLRKTDPAKFARVRDQLEKALKDA